MSSEIEQPFYPEIKISEKIRRIEEEKHPYLASITSKIRVALIAWKAVPFSLSIITPLYGFLVLREQFESNSSLGDLQIDHGRRREASIFYRSAGPRYREVRHCLHQLGIR